MKICAVSGLGSVWSNYAPDVLEGNHAIGGGEASLLRCVQHLASFGHSVTAFIPLAGPSGQVYRGVTFRPLAEAYRSLLLDGYDVLCSWSDVQAILVCPPATRRVYVQQLNDMPQALAFWRAVDAIVPASATHGRFLSQFAPQGASVLYAPLYGGVLPELWKNALPWAQRKPVVSWWSSPDRGLHHLLGIWPVVKKAVPAAELRIAYHMWRYVDGSRDFFGAPEVAYRSRVLEQNFFAAQRAGGVNVLGPISRKALAVHQGETKVWAFTFDPMVQTEGLSVSMGEAISSGTWPIARSDDALHEVYDGYVQWVDSPIPDDAWRGRFSDAIIHALRADVNPYGARAAEFARSFTWEAAARNLERACKAAPKRPDHPLGFSQGM